MIHPIVLPVILLGAGGHAKVLLEALHLNGVEVLGYVAPNRSAEDIGVEYLGDDDQVAKFPVDEVALVNSVGGLTLSQRQRLYDDFKARGYRFAQVVHPSAVVSNGASLGEGVQIMAGAVIQTGARLGEDVILNTRASIDHDCHIERHSHISVGAILAGNIHVGKNVLVGAGSTVIQGIRIGDAAVVGAGAVVLKDVPAGKTVIGVPAR